MRTLSLRRLICSEANRVQIARIDSKLDKAKPEASLIMVPNVATACPVGPLPPIEVLHRLRFHRMRTAVDGKKQDAVNEGVASLAQVLAGIL